MSFVKAVDVIYVNGFQFDLLEDLLKIAYDSWCENT